jgi:Glyoxalase superfamily protein
VASFRDGRTGLLNSGPSRPRRRSAHGGLRAVAASCDSAPVDEDVVPILRVVDAAVAVGWYARLGFTKEWEHRFEPGMPAFVSVARGPVRLFLSEHLGDARPGTLVYLWVEDVDAVAAEFGVTVDQAPWAREVELRDPDGNRLRVGTPPG